MLELQLPEPSKRWSPKKKDSSGKETESNNRYVGEMVKVEEIIYKIYDVDPTNLARIRDCLWVDKVENLKKENPFLADREIDPNKPIV